MSKIKEAIEILKSLGLPRAQQNDRSALTLLALININDIDSWSSATQRDIRIHDILTFIKSAYKREYAENTRETIRRQTLHQFVQAGVAEINRDDPSRPTNSPGTVYAITEETLKAIRGFGTKTWEHDLKEFIGKKGKLVDKYAKKRSLKKVGVTLPNGSSILLSSGKHNELQASVMKELRPRFFADTDLIYIGDTAHKLLYSDKKLVQKLKIPIDQHKKMPDLVFYDSSKNVLFLIEVVTSHGPITPKRQMELEEVLSECPARRIYISAFPDFRQLKKHIDSIAWETEIWVADRPDHMIHFNGPKFLAIQ